MRKVNTKEIFRVCKTYNLIDKDIEYSEFYYIVREFHNLMSNEIADGYTFSTEIGQFSVLKKARTKRSIDWGSSNKRKQKLIDEGKTPYNKDTAPNGEPWFIYFTDGAVYKWVWSKSRGVIHWFQFIPSFYNKVYLGRVIKEKVRTQKEDYNYVNQNNFKPTYSLQDFKDLQTF